MSRSEDIKTFLLKRRARLNPEDYGFNKNNRRVSGLRREEVAQLAAVSASWYTWLEQGRDISISPAALTRIAQVLRLTDIERDYLNALVFGSGSSKRTNDEIPREVMAMVDVLDPHPAFVRRENMDIIYWNNAAKTKIFDWSSVPITDRNSLKLMFIQDDYRRRLNDWESAARHTIASFRAYYATGNHPAAFKSVVDDLMARSAEFRTMWDYHDVSKVGAGNKDIFDDKGQLRHYTYTSLEVENNPGMFVIFYCQRVLE